MPEGYTIVETKDQRLGQVRRRVVQVVAPLSTERKLADIMLEVIGTIKKVPPFSPPVHIIFAFVSDTPEDVGKTIAIARAIYVSDAFPKKGMKPVLFPMGGPNLEVIAHGGTVSLSLPNGGA